MIKRHCDDCGEELGENQGKFHYKDIQLSNGDQATLKIEVTGHKTKGDMDLCKNCFAKHILNLASGHFKEVVDGYISRKEQ
tara:strand:+ start:6005 stop:6247 length:243 start_codon:yes stop_codon:yes gene_type:complete